LKIAAQRHFALRIWTQEARDLPPSESLVAKNLVTR
jgi:hypothetical protein